MRIASLLLLFVFPLAGTTARADTLVLTGSGVDDTFSLPASPTLSTSGSYGFVVSPVLVDEGGNSAVNQITFFNTDLGGGLLLEDGMGKVIDGFGAQLYRGANDAPVFKTGTFALSDIDAYTLTISSTAVTPEPSTLVLVGTGLFLNFLAAAKLRKSQPTAA